MTTLEKGMSIIKTLIIILLSGVCVANGWLIWFASVSLFVTLCMFVFEIFEYLQE